MRVLPDVLIEEDCESICMAEISYAQIPAGVPAGIRSVVMRDFDSFRKRGCAAFDHHETHDVQPQVTRDRRHFYRLARSQVSWIARPHRFC